MKVRSPVLPKNPSGMLFDKIYVVIRNYCRPRGEVVSSKRAKFLSIAQNQGEADDECLLRLREAARYCMFSELKKHI